MTGRRVLLAIALSAGVVGCLQPAYELTCESPPAPDACLRARRAPFLVEVGGPTERAGRE